MFERAGRVITGFLDPFATYPNFIWIMYKRALPFVLLLTLTIEIKKTCTILGQSVLLIWYFCDGDVFLRSVFLYVVFF